MDSFSAMPRTGITFSPSAIALHSQPPASCADADLLVLRHLRTPRDIARVKHLRGHIDLAQHSAADPHFHQHEKKETNWASRSLSSFTACSWGPRAPCPCAMA